MYLQFALVAVLALSGLASPAPRAQDSSAPQERVVGQTVAGAVASTMTPGRTVASGAPSRGVSLKKLDIVVPPVEPSDTVATPGVPLEAQAAAGVLVADQLVAPERVESEVVEAVGYQTLGVTWPEDSKVGDLGAEVRTRTDGKWSEWVELESGGGAPDAGSADAARAVRGGTEPVPIGDADAVQLAFIATAKGGPNGLSLAMIGSAEQPVPDPVIGEATIQTVAYSAAVLPAAASAPVVITRAQWGAPKQRCTPGVASKLVGAGVHHTAGPNTYANVAGAKQQIRNDAVYHISALGWCDIGYNFIVDKWGNIYEGRAGSLTKAVVGAHAGGFNSGTVGVSMLGTYGAAPSSATQRAVARIIGWRLGAYGVDPKGSMTYHAGGGTPGSGQKYFNRDVRLPRVFAHRDVWFTACPGNGGYAAMPNIRAMASTFGYAARFTQARSVVKALYADLLLRPVDPSGLQAWSALLARGVAQPALVASLTRSREYVWLRVGQAYRDVLGRAPDAGGLAAWSGEILAGRIPVDDVQRRLYAGQEFVNVSGGTADGYVKELYTSILGPERDASQTEVDLLAPKVGDQAGRSRVTDSIWFSMEAAKYRAGKYYLLFLKRTADPAGQTRWAQVLLLQGEGAVRTGLAGSGEYRLLALKRFP